MDAAPGPQAAPRRPWRWLAVAVGSLLTVLVIALAAGVFKVRTKDGTIVLENLPPDAEVLVDGAKVTVTWADGKQAQIAVKPGTRQVVATKDGVTVIGDQVEIEAGGTRRLVAHLEPPVKAAPPVALAPPPPVGKGVVPPAAVASPHPVGDGFVPLFNGKDLTGWKTHPSQPGSWRVENGILIGSGPRANGRASHLYTERGDYTDFHLRVEARINDGGNSGVCFRAPFGPKLPANNPRWLLGYEAQIDSTSRCPVKTGGLYALPDGVVISVRESPVPAGEWFTMEVIAEGAHIIIKVNGKVTADYTDVNPRFLSGHIALQQHDPQTVAEFRKIEIRELPPAKPGQ